MTPKTPKHTPLTNCKLKTSKRVEARKEEEENNGEGKRKIATEKSGGQEGGFYKMLRDNETFSRFSVQIF